MADAGSLVTIASIISAFGAVVLLFRIPRELYMRAKKELNWIPWADQLLFCATMVSLFLVIIPVVLIRSPQSAWSVLPKTAAVVASTLAGGYIPAILAHYRLILGKNRSGPRTNPEPGEKLVVWITALVALMLALWALALNARML